MLVYKILSHQEGMLDGIRRNSECLPISVVRVFGVRFSGVKLVGGIEGDVAFLKSIKNVVFAHFLGKLIEGSVKIV